MENAVDALEIAFAVFVFVIAITVSFQVISQAKSTADIVTYVSDETNYYAYNDNTDETIVGFDTVVATIYNYYTESIAVIIKDSDNKLIALFDSSVEKDSGAVWIGSSEKFRERIKYTIEGVNDTTEIGGSQVKIDPSFDDNTPRTESNNILAKEKLINYKDEKFIVTFEETTYSGEYNTPDDYETIDGDDIPDDGSTIQITPGGKKVYITFKVKVT